jgi:mannose-1-phosphate guanylyltransferase
LLVTFGITPTRAATEYGYIKRGAPLGTGFGFHADTFVEKPNIARAAQLVASQEYDWNSGMFLWRADTYLNALQHHAPDIAVAANAAVKAAMTMGDSVILNAAAYETAPALSIDVAVMEPCTNKAVIPCDIGWHDLGSFESLQRVRQN